MSFPEEEETLDEMKNFAHGEWKIERVEHLKYNIHLFCDHSARATGKYYGTHSFREKAHK